MLSTGTSAGQLLPSVCVSVSSAPESAIAGCPAECQKPLAPV